ncbi:MAG: hypothetical protein ACYC7A_04100 [Thermoanaerobaculia bacterium]
MSATSEQLVTLGAQSIGTIDRIEEIVVRLPFVKPFAVSSATWTVKEAILGERRIHRHPARSGYRRDGQPRRVEEVHPSLGVAMASMKQAPGCW